MKGVFKKCHRGEISHWSHNGLNSSSLTHQIQFFIFVFQCASSARKCYYSCLHLSKQMFIINDIGGYIKKSTFAIAFAKARLRFTPFFCNSVCGCTSQIQIKTNRLKKHCSNYLNRHQIQNATYVCKYIF